MAGVDIVTGAFGFSGKYIARRLIESGQKVKTLTNHVRHTDGLEDVEVLPLNFDKPAQLAENMRGADTLYNTYWIRFPRGSMTFEKAVENSKALVSAACEAGVRRIVHVSITNPSGDSPLPYFSGKAQVERAIVESGLSYAILRPAVLFGPEGILINNIAWFLRHLPVFAVPGNGEYRVQPIFVEDIAELAVASAQSSYNSIVDAVGPEAPTMNELVRSIAQAVGSKAVVLHSPATLALAGTSIVGWILRDVILTRDEVVGLLDNVLVSSQTPTAGTRLSDWLAANADWLGRRYQHEVARHYRRN